MLAVLGLLAVGCSPTEAPIAKAEATEPPPLPPRPAIPRFLASCEKVILLTGDSNAEGVGYALRQHCINYGYCLVWVPWYGSTTKSWAESDSLADLIAFYKPDYVMMLVGGNELFVPVTPKRYEYVRDIMAQAGDLPFIWIGPANWAEDWGYGDVLLQELPFGRLFETRCMTLTRARDEMHADRAGHQYWADSLAQWLERYAYVPLPMRASENDTVWPRRFVAMQVEHFWDTRPPRRETDSIARAQAAEAPRRELTSVNAAGN